MRLRLAYGREGLLVDLPDDATVIEPRFVAALPDEQAALMAAMRSPLGGLPLQQLAHGDPEGTVAVVFSDLTRPMPNARVLPVLLQELALAGVSDDHIVLINSLGTHRRQSDTEIDSMLGKAVARRYRVVQHDAWDADQLVEVTRNRLGHPVRVNRTYMAASVRILTGFIEPHFFAGFSGGPKAVLPGLADMDTILDNHDASMVGHSQATWAVTYGNPLWEEMLAGAQATKPAFLFNVTLNSQRQITGVYAGDMVKAHAAGTAAVKQTAMQPVAQPFDIVITSNSGYPLDLNLYQAVKGMAAAARIVRPGGDIIVAAECWDGLPAHGEYQRLLGEASSPQDLLARVMAPGFRCHDQWEAQIQAQIQLKARVHIYATGLSEQQLRQALVTPCRSVEDTVSRLRRRNPSASIAVLPDGPQTIPYLTG